MRRTIGARTSREQAKAHLMTREGLSEPAAFGWLRRRAMERRVRIDVPRGVLEGA